MNRYNFALCATLTLCMPISYPMLSTQARQTMRAMRAARALHTQQTAGSPESAKSAALMLLKKTCGYTFLGSATFFAGHEYGKKKGFEEGFFAGEIYATAAITNQIADRALMSAKQKYSSDNTPQVQI